ncbi:hypothetical protein Lalb_Chr22g0355351 [Lupinus albus]|uniref:Uncharacterized protein n=1 Tax=Lupinus albus TaxID=3870 RepID=A0A6A4NG74_LUPAL|nr:hypothetical protein Lalb_Chr22g0355351 [Lupinus albus]
MGSLVGLFLIICILVWRILLCFYLLCAKTMMLINMCSSGLWCFCSPVCRKKLLYKAAKQGAPSCFTFDQSKRSERNQMIACWTVEVVAFVRSVPTYTDFVTIDAKSLHLSKIFSE